MTLTEYVVKRIAELDALIAAEQEGSKHIYALTAGKYELLLATQHVSKGSISGSWAGDVDRQGGSFTDQEISDRTNGW